MKLEYSKEWFERSAELEGDHEVGAGSPPWVKMKIRRGRTAASETRIAFGGLVELWRRNQGWNAEQLAEQPQTQMPPEG